MADLGEWTFTVIVPSGGGECREFEVDADPTDRVSKFKQRIEKKTSIPADDMELFCQNTESSDCKQKWLSDDSTLQEQEVVEGAQIFVGVHGMRSSAPAEVDPETGEAEAGDHVQSSINSKGDTSYYFAHARKGELSEEQRIVSGGSPQKIAECEARSLDTAEPPPLASAMFDDGTEAPGRPIKTIKNYAWGDEKHVIKIYISKESESEAVQAAGSGKDGQVEVKWLPKALRLTVHGEQFDFVLILENIYYDIVPEECSFRVSLNKRISLSLKKKEEFTWLKLLRPE